MKRILPSRELCERIPKGCFEHALHAWHLAKVSGIACGTSGCRTVHGKQWQIIRSTKARIDEARAAGDLIFPAPTAEEILFELPKDDACNDLHVGHSSKGKTAGFHVYYIGDRLRHCHGGTIAEAALKLFLKTKGIKQK